MERKRVLSLALVSAMIAFLILPSGSSVYAKAPPLWTDAGYYDEVLYASCQNNTVADTIEIDAPEELAAIAKACNNGVSFMGKRVVLMKDIDLDGKEWVPIGTDLYDAKFFAGTFDGRNHTVKNMSVYKPYSNTGLFGAVSGDWSECVIQNVTVEGNIDSCEGAAGGIAGMAEKGSIINCTSNVYINAFDVTTGDVVLAGGIAGGSDGGLMITGCTSNSELAVEMTIPALITVVAGGIIGLANNNNGMVSILNSENHGSVTCYSGIGGAFLGGVAGCVTDAEIVNCYNTGTIAGALADDTMTSDDLLGQLAAGGICGYYSIDADPLLFGNCYNAGSITAVTSGGIFGLIGVFEKDMIKNNFYLNGSSSDGVGYYLSEGTPLGTDSADSLTASEMTEPAFPDQLNLWAQMYIPGLQPDSWTQISGENSGYPVLLKDQPAPEGLTGTATTAAGNDGRINGTASTMEYRPASSGIYTICSDTAIAGLTAGNYLVRYAAKAGYIAGEEASVNVPAYTESHHSGGGGSSDKAALYDKIGRLVNSEEGGSSSILTVDADAFANKLKALGNNELLTMSLSEDADLSAVRLTGRMVRDLESHDGTLEIKTGSEIFTLPAAQFFIDDVAEQFGQNIDLSDITVQIQMEQLTGKAIGIRENTSEAGTFSVMAPAVNFTIRGTYQNRTVEVGSFQTFVERAIAVPDGVDPYKITTGIVVNADGTIRHVPTRIIQKDGKYYAAMNSLTNSTYALVWNPVEFSDVSGHWAKGSINDLGSRMIAAGDENNLFHPDRSITRAEFTAIMVRALGLAETQGKSRFSDVNTDDWYCGYTETAAAYGLVGGNPDGTFGPADRITREQAMTIIAAAAKLTGLAPVSSDAEISVFSSEYTDFAETSAYAKSNIAFCLKTGIASGRSESVLAPKDAVTRAEAAVFVQRLLQKSNLI